MYSNTQLHKAVIIGISFSLNSAIPACAPIFPKSFNQEVTFTNFSGISPLLAKSFSIEARVLPCASRSIHINSSNLRNKTAYAFVSIVFIFSAAL